MAIFLSLFVMVILQSCEKETVEVTEQEPEQEHQEEIITVDKLLEREGAVRLHLQRNWGTYYISDEYVEVALEDDYCIKDIYVCSTRKKSIYERISGCVLVPIDLNMGYPEKYSEKYLKKHPKKRRYRVFLVLDIKRYTKGMWCVKDLQIFDNDKDYPDSSVLDELKYSRYHVCKYIPANRWVNKGRLNFHTDKCNLNRGTGGNYLYLRQITESGKDGAIRRLRIVYNNYGSFDKGLMKKDGFKYDADGTNLGNRSLTGVYLGWK